MASGRALALVAALNALLLGALVADFAAPPPPRPSPRLFPELAGGAPEAIEVRGGEPFVATRRGRRWELLTGGEADARALGDVVGALELLRSRRRAPGRGRDAALGLADPRATLTLTLAGRSQKLRFGRPAGDGASVWVGLGDDAHAVDAALADAVLPKASEVRPQHPLAALADAQPLAIELAGGGRWTLRGRVLEVAGGTLRLDVSGELALRDALRELSVARYLTPGEAADEDQDLEPSGGERIATFSGGGERVVFVRDGRCEADEVALYRGTEGVCAAAAATATVMEAAQLSRLAERDLVPLAAALEVAQGGERARLDSLEAQRAFDRWLGELAAAREGELAPVGPERLEIARIRTPLGEERWHLSRDRRGFILSLGDAPLGERVAEGAAVLMAPQPGRFGSLELVRAEPTAIAAVELAVAGRVRSRWRRGELLGEWRTIPSGEFGSAEIEAAIALLADLRGERRLAGADFKAGRTLRLRLEPAVGPPSLLELDIGSAATGCAVRRRGKTDSYSLTATRCRRLEALFGRPSPPLKTI